MSIETQTPQPTAPIVPEIERTSSEHLADLNHAKLQGLGTGAPDVARDIDAKREAYHSTKAQEIGALMADRTVTKGFGPRVMNTVRSLTHNYHLGRATKAKERHSPIQ